MDWQISESICPKCNQDSCRKRSCDQCGGEGYSDHDCGDDCCACLYPENNVHCDVCDKKGWLEWCSSCGWDLTFNRFLAPQYEAEFLAKQKAA